MIADITTIQNLGFNIKGIVHVGANDGEEVPYYQQAGIENIVLFEPLYEPYKKALKYKSDKVKVFNLGWSNKTGMVDMNVTKNDKASSMLTLKPHGDPAKHPVLKDWNMGQLPVVDQQRVMMIEYGAFDTPEDKSPYDCLVMDVQGMTLQALWGMHNEIDRFKYMIVELSQDPVYEEEASGETISMFLNDCGFKRMTEILPHDNVLFIRKWLL